MTTRHPSSGNALFYILLCIALFAALGYAFSRGGTGGTQAISDEKAKLYASEIINFGNQMQQAVVKLKLRGCQSTQFDFTNSVYKRVDQTALIYSNNLSPTDDSCDVFSNSGAKLIPYVPSQEAVTAGSTYSGSGMPGHGVIKVAQIKDIGTDGIAGLESANDLSLGMRYISPSVCSMINYLLGISSKKDDPLPTISETGTVTFYSNGNFAASTGKYSGAAINGKTAFCVYFNSLGGEFYQVLLAR